MDKEAALKGLERDLETAALAEATATLDNDMSTVDLRKPGEDVNAFSNDPSDGTEIKEKQLVRREKRRELRRQHSSQENDEGDDDEDLDSMVPGEIIQMYDKGSDEKIHACSLKDNPHTNCFWRLLSILHQLGHAVTRFPCCSVKKSKRRAKKKQSADATQASEEDADAYVSAL